MAVTAFRETLTEQDRLLERLTPLVREHEPELLVCPGDEDNYRNLSVETLRGLLQVYENWEQFQALIAGSNDTPRPRAS
jgi:hypothetical protein